MMPDAERWAFRAVVAVAGLVPVGGGLYGVLAGAAAFDGAPSAALDSHVRYLSGLLLGIGVAFWTTLGRPERYGRRYRLLTAIVVAGGAARLYGAIVDGAPPAPMLFGLVMELVVTPAVCWWQARIAARGNQVNADIT